MRVSSFFAISALVAVCVLGVAACENVPSVTTARALEDGAHVEKSWVRTWKDHARFECVASSNGLCEVVVFVSECPGPACKLRIVREFSLRPGAAADLFKLPPNFRWCLAHGVKPIAPACLNG
jgi:hypothetical protein